MMHGEVIKVGNDKRSGLYVTLRHGDFTVSYSHLSLIKQTSMSNMFAENTVNPET